MADRVLGAQRRDRGAQEVNNLAASLVGNVLERSSRKKDKRVKRLIRDYNRQAEGAGDMIQVRAPRGPRSLTPLAGGRSGGARA